MTASRQKSDSYAKQLTTSRQKKICKTINNKPAEKDLLLKAQITLPLVWRQPLEVSRWSAVGLLAAPALPLQEPHWQRRSLSYPSPTSCCCANVEYVCTMSAEHTAPASKTSMTNVQVSTSVKHVVQTIIQHAAEAFHDKARQLSSVLAGLQLSTINWKSNGGHVIEALLHRAGLSWSATGKTLWRRAEPGVHIQWRQLIKAGSLRPAAPTVSALGDLDASELQHNPEASCAAGGRAQVAAEARRPRGEAARSTPCS